LEAAPIRLKRIESRLYNLERELAYVSAPQSLEIRLSIPASAGMASCGIQRESSLTSERSPAIRPLHPLPARVSLNLRDA
jgi:hypothetical protein